MTHIIVKEDIDKAAKCLKNGGTVVFPTETVYGLGANAQNDDAVYKIYKAKGRPSDNPLIIHIADKDDVYKIAETVSDDAKKLIDTFWPGPLTLIFKKNAKISSVVTAGLNTVAVRMPSNEIARELIKKSGVFVAAPSANLSGSPSPTNVKHVIDDLNGKVDYIIDGENCEIGIESTVLNVSEKRFKILRPGVVTYEQILKVTDLVDEYVSTSDEIKTPQSPGMKYTHYAPKAKVVVVSGNLSNTKKYIQQKLNEQKVKTGVISYMNTAFENANLVLNAGESMKEYAKGLYNNLRTFDENNIEIVYAQFEEKQGVGTAVKNRIYKAAGYNIVKV